MAGVTVRDRDVIVHIHVPDGETYFVVNGKRIYMLFHNYCGPSFYHDRDHCHQVNYADYPPEHKVWDHFGRWYKKYQKQKQRKQQEYENSRNRSSGVHRDEPVQLTLKFGPPGVRPRQYERRLS